MRGACVVGDMHGRGCAWQGECVQGGCMAGGMHGIGHAWQETRPLLRAVDILLECILVSDVAMSRWQQFKGSHVQVFPDHCLLLEISSM